MGSKLSEFVLEMCPVYGHKRLDDDASLASLAPEKRPCCVLDALGRRPVETQKNSSWDNLYMSDSGI